VLLEFQHATRHLQSLVQQLVLPPERLEPPLELAMLEFPEHI